MVQNIDWTKFLYVFLALAGIALVIAVFLIAYVVWRIKRINLPDTTDIMTTLRATPLVVVIVLDLLDFSLDFFSAPFAWALLSYLGLKPLRGITVIESVIPGTQLLPTMTLAWIIARVSRKPSLLP